MGGSERTQITWTPVSDQQPKNGLLNKYQQFDSPRAWDTLSLQQNLIMTSCSGGQTISKAPTDSKLRATKLVWIQRVVSHPSRNKLYPPISSLFSSFPPQPKENKCRRQPKGRCRKERSPN
eukprot:1161972-Pelagomonas_calceolata.AAC.14